jgi:diacylglycerol kinase family enzyme
MSENLLLVNAGAGRAKKGSELETLLTSAGQQNNLRVHLLQPHDNIPQIVKKAIKQGANAIGAAGGDGTINSIASALVDTKVPLVVIPFGTLNHFARDIGVPTQFVQAMELFESGESLTIDVGEVNGHYFLNNSSVGIYSRLVKEREKHEKRLGKWLAFLVAARQVLRYPRLVHIKLDIEGQSQDLKVGLIFFSNNRADMSPLVAGHRPRLDGQILDTYVVKASTPFEFFRVASNFLRNRLEESPLVTRTEACEATVYTANHRLRVAFDGEVQVLTSPLHYRIHPAALVVKVPAATLEQSEAKETGHDKLQNQVLTTPNGGKE